MSQQKGHITCFINLEFMAGLLFGNHMSPSPMCIKRKSTTKSTKPDSLRNEKLLKSIISKVLLKLLFPKQPYSQNKDVFTFRKKQIIHSNHTVCCRLLNKCLLFYRQPSHESSNQMI